MHRPILFAAILAVSCGHLTASDNISKHLAETPPAHPRLLLHNSDLAALRQKIASDTLFARTAKHIVTQAQAMLDFDPVRRDQQVGRRLLTVSRTAEKRIVSLAFAYHLTGERVFAERAEQEMLAAAAFSDWNPSHFLDVAEMTAALAIGYDWLYDVLSPASRQTIREAIVEKGLKPSFDGGPGWKGWLTTNNNWSQVCYGGLTLGALAVMEDEPKLAEQIVRRAISSVPKALAEYAPDGAYPEGPSYWNYGTTYNVLMVAALEEVLGSDFALSELPGFLESSDYYTHVTGPTGMFFNYSDSGARRGVSPAIYWFAARRNKPSLLWSERPLLAQFLENKHNAADASDRLLPLLLVWAMPPTEAPAPEQTSWAADGPTPLGLHRSGWNDPSAVFVAVKGGSPSVNHAHMDVGSFVLDAVGARWAEDLGRQSYESLESRGIGLWSNGQEGQRWDIFRLNNLSHNTLVVDGQKQRVTGHAPIIGFSDKAPMPHTIVDMTSVYDGQLASARRGVGLREDGLVLVQDEVESLDREASVRWGMVTRAEVTMEGPRSALLRRDGKQLRLTVLSPADAQLELFEVAKPPRDFDEPNPGAVMIGFTAKLPASTSKRLIVSLSPGEVKREQPSTAAISDW